MSLTSTVHGGQYDTKYIIKWKNVRCEIEDFVETYLCKLRGILRSRVLRVLCNLKNVSLHIIYMWHSSCFCMRHSFVADEIWGFMLKPARRTGSYKVLNRSMHIKRYQVCTYRLHTVCTYERGRTIMLALTPKVYREWSKQSGNSLWTLVAFVFLFYLLFRSCLYSSSLPCNVFGSWCFHPLVTLHYITSVGRPSGAAGLKKLCKNRLSCVNPKRDDYVPYLAY